MSIEPPAALSRSMKKQILTITALTLGLTVTALPCFALDAPVNVQVPTLAYDESQIVFWCGKSLQIRRISVTIMST